MENQTNGCKNTATEPTALQLQEYRVICNEFSNMMYKELVDNHGKGGRVGPNGWLNQKPSYLAEEIHYHVSKLTCAVMNNEREAVDEHAADVANLCLMLAEKSGTKYMTPIPFKVYSNQQTPFPIDATVIEANVIKLIMNEVKRAEEKHPKFGRDTVHRAAIVAEEAGELVRASLQYEYEEAPLEPILTEAIHTAATCIRILKIPMYQDFLPVSAKKVDSSNNETFPACKHSGKCTGICALCYDLL